MNKKTIILLITIVASSFFAAAILFAGTTVPDTFKMETKEYTVREYNPATLSHKKHIEEYNLKCGECHHNEKNEPLNDLKPGDKVQRCIECHKIPSKKPKKKKGMPKVKLSDKQRREYHAEALHDNCKKCHKSFNKEIKKFNKKVTNKNDRKATAPTSCPKCHKGGKIK